MAAFIPGRELNRDFYHEVVRPLLAARFPRLPYSAALMGFGSDVLGYDTARSTDHEWGPRLLLFLDQANYEATASAVSETLIATLPSTFRGYSTGFSAKDAAGSRVSASAEPGRVAHHIDLHTVEVFLQQELGVPGVEDIGPLEWLVFPEQKLLAIISGAVYHDGLGRLEPTRQRLAYFPHDVWRYLLSAQWTRLAQEEAFMGRCGELGDDLGSRLIAARLVHDLMKLCFLQERRYAPYAKWFGTAFAQLASAPPLLPILERALAAASWTEREEQLTQAYEFVARKHNALGITESLDPAVARFHDRPYRVLHAGRFAEAIQRQIQDPALLDTIAQAGSIGAVDQFSDNTDLLTSPQSLLRLRALYSPLGE